MATTVVPAHGRDYKSKKAVLEAWASGKDFIISDHFSKWDGKPINKEDADRSKTDVNVRYNKLKKVVVIKHENKDKTKTQEKTRTTSNEARSL